MRVRANGLSPQRLRAPLDEIAALNAWRWRPAVACQSARRTQEIVRIRAGFSTVICRISPSPTAAVRNVGRKCCWR